MLQKALIMAANLRNPEETALLISAIGYTDANHGVKMNDVTNSVTFFF